MKKKIKEEITTSNSGVVPDELPKEMNGIHDTDAFGTMLRLKNKKLMKKYFQNAKDEKDEKKGDILTKLEKMLDSLTPPIIRQKEEKKMIEEKPAPEKTDLVQEEKVSPDEVFSYVPIDDFIKKEKDPKKIILFINKALVDVKKTLGVNIIYSEKELIKAIQKKLS